MKNIRKILNRLDFIDNKIFVTKHCLINWHKRVDNNFNSPKELAMYIKRTIILDPSSIEHYQGDFYLFKNDILICADKQNNEYIYIITVWGKLSINPCLKDIRAIRHTGHHIKIAKN